MKMFQNELHLPGDQGGRGDPYVLRFNGRYYLYPSTHGDECGVRVWISENLVDWREGGFVVRDACLQNAYAPEVFYYNGRFLLVTSPFGRGHFLYEGESPTGPFRQVRDNFGLVIDGSIFADDDAQLYFTHAEYPAIHGHTMTPQGEMGEAVILDGTCMGHWTEGSGIFKRGGKYYITMTGNHLLSRAYRIDYALSDDGPLGPYRMPEQKTLLVNTDRAHGSLGHSSNTIGPDLDGYWICYHNFEINDMGRHTRRNANLDRMLFNGDKLLVSGPTRGFTPAPEMPDAYGWADDPACAGAFEPWADGVLLRAPAGEAYTAEATFVPGEGAEMAFALEDPSHYLSLTFAQGTLRLTHRSGEETNLLFEKPLFAGFRADVRHTLRLEVRGGRLHLLLDHMTQGEGIPLPICAGQIGVRASAWIGYLAFSRHVGQRSDFEHYHALPGAVEAALFLSAALAGESPEHPAEACGFRPEDGLRLLPGADGGQDLWLAAGEAVSYRGNAQQGGDYHLQAVLQVRQDALLELELPAGTLRVELAAGDMGLRDLAITALAAGLFHWKLRLIRGEVVLRRFELFPKAEPLAGQWQGLALGLAAHQVEGMGSDGFLPRHEGLQMDREVQAMGIFGQRFLTEGWIEADLRFRGQGVEKSAGLFLRLSEDSFHPDQIRVGHRGYYVGFDTQRLWVDRMNFDARELGSAPFAMEIEKVYRVKACIRGGTLTVFVDGLQILQVSEADPLPYGRFAVGSFGARVTVERLALDVK